MFYRRKIVRTMFVQPSLVLFELASLYECCARSTYKPDTRDSVTLGLAISTPARPGYGHLFDNSAAVLFLRNDSLHFQDVGELAAQPERATDDRCRASCMDWYGNARPLFVRGRVIALLGYELVEGTLHDGRMRESRRV